MSPTSKRTPPRRAPGRMFLAAFAALSVTALPACADDTEKRPPVVVPSGSGERGNWLKGSGTGGSGGDGMDQVGSGDATPPGEVNPGGIRGSYTVQDSERTLERAGGVPDGGTK